jgi:hypothetical protein
MASLEVLCNGCGKPMKNTGEWPIGEQRRLAQVYACETCRHPDRPVMVSIIENVDG